MRQTVWLLILSYACGLMWCPRPASAQPRYRPARPTFSPWLELGRRDSGPLGSYLSNVRPEIELRETLREQDTRLRFQGANLQALGSEVMRLGQPESVRPTGAGSVFMYYSHFYPALGSAPRPRAARTPRAALAPSRPSVMGAMGGGLGLLRR